MKMLQLIAILEVNLFCEAVWRARARNLGLRLTIVCLKLQLHCLNLKNHLSH